MGSFLAFFVALFLASVALLTWPVRYVLKALRPKPRRSGKARIDKAVVIGFDGMEPSLVERFMEQGLLPNLSRLARDGSYLHLRSTWPPLSPVAWSTFQTGVNPGKHGIFDFFERNPKTYLGELSSARIRPPEKLLRIRGLQFPLERPAIRLLRRSQPFWRLLGDRGIFGIVLRVPITFPPERFNGISLSAMCVPDLRGTQGTFTSYTTRPDREGMRTGGEVIPLEPHNGRIRTWIFGPPHPFRSDNTTLKVPLEIEMLDEAIEIRVNGGSYRLGPREYSPWVPVVFRAGFLRIRGIVRFYLHRVRPHLDLYMTPVNIDPASPSLPISHPPSFSMYLAKKNGPFATLGLAEDTWALNEGALDDRSFLEQCYTIQQEREAMFWDAMEHLRKGLLVCVFDITDRVQHMFWRRIDPDHPANGAGNGAGDPGDPIQRAYEQADRLVGEVLDRLDDETMLIVMSDHGFCSFRRCFHVNAWLRENGFLELKPGIQPGEWFQGVDWTRTRAFAVGLGGIYLNLKGREREGIVTPGEEEQRLKDEIKRKLRGIRDPETGEIAILDVKDRREIYRGPYTGEAPDLLIGYHHGYRTAWESAVGGIVGQVFSDNTKKWSGDHCLPPDRVPGIFFSNKRFNASNLGIVDIAPTILDAFGIDPPEYMDGRAASFEEPRPGQCPGNEQPEQKGSGWPRSRSTRN